MELFYLDKAKEVLPLLRPYQHSVLKDMVEKKRWLNYLDMGMGKSLVTLLSVVAQQAFPCVIFSNKAAMGVLANELEKWFDAPSTIYSGTPKERDAAWSRFVVGQHNFIIANYAMSAELAERFNLKNKDVKKWKYNGGQTLTAKATPAPPHLVRRPQAMICDEIHTAGLFNHKAVTYGNIKMFAEKVEVCYLLTGTPYRKGVVDFFGPLSLIDPVTFDSYWKYVGRHCVTINTGFGKAIERNPANAEAFRKMLREYASLHKKEDYLHDLPAKIRGIVPVFMSGEQKKIYDELTEELMAITDEGELIMTPSQLTLMIRQRQLLVCPQELGLKDRGAAIDSMISMMEDQFIEDKPVVVFTPFRKAVSWIRKAISEEYKGTPIYEITGGLSPQEFSDTWKDFQRGPSETGDRCEQGFRVLICVIKSSASFHATAADTAYFIGCEYDFNQNAQAEDRIYRIGQTRAVNCHYLLYKNTVDDSILNILNDKAYGADVVLTPDKVFREMLEARTRRK